MSSKYHIPGFVELDRLPSPNSLQYPANDIEPTLCAYVVWYGSELFADLTSYGVAPEKFQNAEWAKLWMILGELNEGGELDKIRKDLPFLWAYLQTKGYEKVYSRQLIGTFATKTTFKAAAFMWATMLNERYRRAQVAEQTALGLEALKEDKDELSKRELLTAIEIIEQDVQSHKEVEDWDEIARKFANEAGQAKGQPQVFQTGIYHVDHLTSGGMREGDLWIFGGATGQGKSALMLQCAGYAARQGARLLVVSMEMSKRENLMRILASTYGGDFGLLMTDPEQVVEGSEAYKHIGGCLRNLKKNGASLKVTSKGTQTIETIRALVRRHRPQVLAVDYIGLVQGEEGSNREERYSRTSSKLKALAKDFGCVVLTGAQLNSDGKLYAAKSIAFDATLVGIIDRESGIWIDKVRNAQKPDDALPYFLNGSRQRFEHRKE